MELLVVDIGNTHIVVGHYRARKRCHVWRLATNPHRTADEYHVLLDGLLSGNTRIDAAGVCSVVPALTHEWLNLLKRIDVETWWLQPGRDEILPLDVDSPRDVGADRMLAAWSARQKYGEPLIVVDCGTAVTIDVVSDEGAYCGGVILPGPRMAAAVLGSGTALLPQVSLARPPSVIGRTTETCIQSGLYFGWADMLQGLIRRMHVDLAQECQVIATGGLAGVWAEEENWYSVYDEHLMLDGFAELLRERSQT